jgi:hypothetical protein
MKPAIACLQMQLTCQGFLSTYYTFVLEYKAASYHGFFFLKKKNTKAVPVGKIRVHGNLETRHFL